MATATTIPQIEAAPVAVSTRKPRPSQRLDADEEFCKRFRALHALGMSQPEMAAELMISRQTVLKIQRRLGLASNPVSSKRKSAVTAEQMDRIKILAVECSQTEIMKRVGVPRSLVRKVFKEFNIALFKKPPKPEQAKPTEKVCVIKITTAMKRCADKRGIQVGAYFVQLFEADAAEDRLKKICANAKPEPAPIFKKVEPSLLRFKKIDGTVAQRVLFLSSSENLNAPEIAQRIGASVSTVRRILDAHKGSAIRGPGTQKRQRSSWDALQEGAAARARGEASA